MAVLFVEIFSLNFQNLKHVFFAAAYSVGKNVHVRMRSNLFSVICNEILRNPVFLAVPPNFLNFSFLATSRVTFLYLFLSPFGFQGVLGHCYISLDDK